ncbi:MAG: acyl-ACP--UDP-N-acetylglucosamine O-acyltransferase [Elusimicrobiaceae bacterium]|nr:acyl-ACP--UDP-N-acetylglucosamine O-acyltransferase [Elusimicrobiaceae bacterium]
MTNPNIHPTAIIDPSAKIGEGTVVGPFTIIGKGVTIGKNNKIGPSCVIENTTMGDENELIGHCFIGVKPQDLSYKDGFESRVQIGNKNKIRECVTIHRSTKLDQPTVIGDSCLLMANSHVAHDCILGNNIILVNCCGVAGHVRIADHAILSGLTGVHQFVRIGRLAMLSGLSGLMLDLPPFCYATGTRAKLAGINVIGLRRAGFSSETIRAIKHAYMELFLSTRTMKESIELLRSKPQVPEVMEMIEFCEKTERGLTTPRKKTNNTEEDADE